MSQVNVEKFFDKVENDTGLAEGYKSFLSSCKDLSEDKTLEEVVSFAKEKGYLFSTEDIKSFAKNKESDELKEEELDLVAGGQITMQGFATVGDTTMICLLIGYESS